MALKKSKPKKTLPSPDVNITSLMDVLTTLIFFIIMMASFNNFLSVPASPLHSGKPSEAEQKPVFTLKIAVVSDTTAKIFIGPTQELDVTERGQFEKYMRAQFSNNGAGHTRTVTEKSKEKLLSKLQDILSKIKESFPNETRAVVAFTNRITYQTTIDAISAVRSLAPDKSAVQLNSGLGQSAKTRVLFPEVIISEWSEE